MKTVNLFNQWALKGRDSGMAKNPENLMNPDDEALDELDRLLSKEFDSDE